MSSTRPANHHGALAAGEGTGQPRNRLFERHTLAFGVEAAWLLFILVVGGGLATLIEKKKVRAKK